MQKIIMKNFKYNLMLHSIKDTSTSIDKNTNLFSSLVNDVNKIVCCYYIPSNNTMLLFNSSNATLFKNYYQNKNS
jgi:hypothetical protein